jgi:Ca2+-binding EF-hand superfamily protein
MKSLFRYGIALVTAGALVGVGLAQVPGEVLPPRELFLQLDANQDGAIDHDEVPAKARPAFERLVKQGDANHNGKLEAEEFRAVLVELKEFSDYAKKKAVDRFQAMDQDRDGKVSREEFTGPKPRFDQLDKNGDGFLTQQEFLGGVQAKAAAKNKKATLKKKAATVKKAD